MDGTPWSDEVAGRPWLRGNLHTHTTNSDGRNSPQEAIDWFAASGYNLLALTDHNSVTDPASLEGRGMILLAASEVSARGGELGGTYHLVSLGVTPDTVLPPVTDVAATSIRALRAAGAVVFVAHPHWSGLTVGDLLVAREAGASGIEIFNGGTVLDSQKGEALVQWDEALARGARLLGIAVDDTHWHTIDRGLGWVMVRPAESTAASVLEALAMGRFYASTGPEIREVAMARRADGIHVTVETSPCAAIYALGFGSRNQFAFDREAAARGETGATITSATFVLRDLGAPGYVRIQCTDWQHRSAWSNPLYPDPAGSSAG